MKLIFKVDSHTKMIPLPVKLLVAFTCFTAVYIRGQAADTCPTTTTSCIPGLPGRDGKDGQPGHDGRDGVVGPAGRDGSNGTPGRDGRDGLPGPPGSLTIVEQQQLKDSILEILRDEISMLCQSQQCNTGTSRNNPATSCKEVHNHDPTPPSGYYWINTTSRGPVQVYCEMDTNNCGNITGGWMRAAYIDMTNVNNTCPAGLNYTIESSKRMCTRSHSDTYSCSSVTFPLHGVPYTKVCGRARGYQFNYQYSFYTYHHTGQSTLDRAYVTGLSVTYGHPRNHVWTFAGGLTKGINDNNCCNCPCAFPTPGTAAPPFVGENYFCESGIPGTWLRQWYFDDPLWDSQGCASGSTCCNRGGPWFTTTLNQEVSDDIELRMCHGHDSSTENIGIEQLEILVY